MNNKEIEQLISSKNKLKHLIELLRPVQSNETVAKEIYETALLIEWIDEKLESHILNQKYRNKKNKSQI